MAGHDLRAGSQISLFAEFYDILHAGLGDVEAYTGYARRFSRPACDPGDPDSPGDSSSPSWTACRADAPGPLSAFREHPKVLELGSGTGRILIPMAAAGFRVTGVDKSDEMIALCMEKLGREPDSTRSRVRLVIGDVGDIDLGETFDLVIAPCNLLTYMTQRDQALSLFETARRHLKDSGVFIMDCSIPDVRLMVNCDGVPRTFEFEHPLTGTTIAYTLTPYYDFVNQLETDHLVLEERDGDDVLRREETTAKLAFYFPREVRLMLEVSGLEVFHEQGSVVENVPLNEHAGEMVFFARKA